MSDADRNSLEIRRLRQDLWLKPLTVVLTVVGAVLVLGGVVLERWFTRQDGLRQWDVERMTEIAGEIDDLFGRTFVTRAADEWQLWSTSGELEEALRQAKEDLQKTGQDIDSVDDAILKTEELRAAIERGDEPIARLIYGQVVVGAEWRSRDIAPTPDFALLFGDDLAAEWRKLASEVREALPGLELSFFLARVSPVAEKLETLRQRGFEFRTRLRERIERRASSW